MERRNVIEEQRDLLERNSFGNYNGVEVTYADGFRAEGHLDLTDKSMNPYGICHGGAYFVLADVTGGVAARSNGQRYVTQQSNVNFIYGVKGGRINCTAEVVSRGRHICIVDVRITDAEGRLAFTGTFDYFCLD